MDQRRNKSYNSFTSSTLENSKETAIKLTNKYTDSLNSLKEENRQLKIKMEDLEF